MAKLYTGGTGQLPFMFRSDMVGGVRSRLRVDEEPLDLMGYAELQKAEYFVMMARNGHMVNAKDLAYCYALWHRMIRRWRVDSAG